MLISSVKWQTTEADVDRSVSDIELAMRAQL